MALFIGPNADTFAFMILACSSNVILACAATPTAKTTRSADVHLRNRFILPSLGAKIRPTGARILRQRHEGINAGGIRSAHEKVGREPGRPVGGGPDLEANRRPWRLARRNALENTQAHQ